MVLGVDVGGTFTDAVALTRDGLFTGKAPTTPQDQSEGVMAAIEEALGRAGARAGDVERLVHGMTVGTNALLEGNVACTALVATAGFTDLEQLGRQARPELYRLCAGHPPPLVPSRLRVGAAERCGPEGVLTELDEQALSEELRRLEQGVESVAVCLLWGFRHPEHERAAARLARAELAGVHVSTSHETAGIFREYERLATTVVDAALSPLTRAYIERLAVRTREAGLPLPEVMLSSGGVADAASAAAHGSWTVLSGPAGGAVGAARAARRAVRAPRPDLRASRSLASPREDCDAVGLDMGGTSCDVSLLTGGEVAVTGGREVGGRALALPMVDVHTVGAGGGSVAWQDEGGALRAGPRSAGASPGPACYGRGGSEPTVTDANLLLGYLDSETPLAGAVSLDRDVAERALATLAAKLDLSVQDTAAGVVRVAGAEMAQAVRVVTVERGIDPRALALVAFGGAGPLHAAQIATELGMRRVVAPAASGVLSALGLAVSERRRDLRQSVLLTGDELTREALEQVVERLATRGREELDEPRAAVRATYELRYAGQAFELPVEGEPRRAAPSDGDAREPRDGAPRTSDARGDEPRESAPRASDAHDRSTAPVPEPGDLRRAFDDAHAERYGYHDADAELELVTVRVSVALPAGDPSLGVVRPIERRGARPARFGEDWHDTAVLAFGEGEVEGPAIVELPGSTLVVPPGWAGRADAEAVILER